MKINKEIIAKLNPCKDRFDNFIAQYPKFDGDLKDFIRLDKITYHDKVWVFVRLATKEQNVKWSLLCASSVLSIFENKYPDDKRPRKALEAVENSLKDQSNENKAAVASYASAYAASAAAASAEAAYAAYAAYAAHAAHAAYAAYAAYAAAVASSAADASAYAASAAAASAAAARDDQQEVNLLFMIEAIK